MSKCCTSDTQCVKTTAWWFSQTVQCAWTSPLFRPSYLRWAGSSEPLIPPITPAQSNKQYYSSIVLTQRQESYRLQCIYPCNWGRSQNWGSRRQQPASGIWAARRGICAPACTGEGPGWISVRGSWCPTACALHPKCCRPPSRTHRSPHTFSGTKAPAQREKSEWRGEMVERGSDSAMVCDVSWN